MSKCENNKVWILPVRAVPNASRNEVIGFESGECKIKLRAVPEDGKANKELVRFLAKTTGVSRNAIELQSGETSRHKRLKVSGIDRMEFLQRLGIAPGEENL